MILDLHRQGLSLSAIARQTGLDRKTVRGYIQRGLEPPAYRPRPPRTSKITAFQAYLRERVAAYPELTASRLHRELRDLGYGGGYTSVKDVLRDIRPVAVPGFEVRFETAPGRQAQVDFAHFRTVFTDEPGIERVVWLFSLVLGHSRMLWGRFVPQQDMQTVLRCHAAAFDALGGAPAEILYDRMKTVVGREVSQGDGSQGGHIVYNRTLVEFC
jgi:transposase